jgi:four helix bundle protein
MKDEKTSPGSPDKNLKSLKERTMEYALQIVRLYGALPRTSDAQIFGRQVLRCGTSVGAQYREAFRAKSDADFVSKMDGALGELDESDYWLELMSLAKIVKPERLDPLRDETKQLMAIFVTAIKRVKNKRKP